MRLTILFLVLFVTGHSKAVTFTSTIHSISYGKAGSDHFLRFDNGRVGFFKTKDLALLQSIQAIRTDQAYADVAVDKSSNILTLAESKYVEPQSEEDASLPMYEEPYQPTVVRDINGAIKIQNKMRSKYRSAGQCYNRAHVWAFEEHKRSKTNLMKVFMFFTERYIRNYKFHWWFHVTPMVYVKNQSSPRTLDRRYTAGPRTTKVWSDVFVRSKRLCPSIKKFDEFFLNQQKQDCYHIHASMYYVTPRDLEVRDLTGVEKTEFNDKVTKKAYLDGFGIKWNP